MNTKKTSKNLKSLEQLRKEKGKTSWSRLIAEEKSSNNQIQPTRKPRG